MATKNAGEFLAISIAVAMQHRAHRRIEHIQGFAQSHWMPPLVDCLHLIVPAAAMVNKFE